MEISPDQAVENEGGSNCCFRNISLIAQFVCYFLNTLRKVFTQFIHPEAADFPAEALKLKVAPVIIVFPPSARSAMESFAINLHVNF